MESSIASSVPRSDIDFWSDEVLLDPYPHYKALRDAGPCVWLNRHDAWAVTRHASLRDALLKTDVFSSARGCSMNAIANAASEGVMICSDDPHHRELRRVFARPLMPTAVAPLRARLVELAATRVELLLGRGKFDAVTELAHFLPLTVVTELVGLSDEGKKNMLAWAAGIFDALGPASHPRTLAGLEVLGQAVAYLGGIPRESLDPNGWGAALFDAADRGDISPDSARSLLMDYLGPSLDTTINATSSAVLLFANHVDQWNRLREDPALIPRAIDEVLRLETPIRLFSRYVTRDYELEGIALRQGNRALMLYACANRDERRYAEPEMFDIARNARDHLAFGYGTHQCAGMHLARLEMTVLLEILARRVARFQVLDSNRIPHNSLRGLARLNVAVEAA